MNTKIIQSDFFKKLETKIPKEDRLVETLAVMLDLDVGSCYKRIRGETALKLDEFVLLSKKFNISVDDFIHSDNQKRFRITNHRFLSHFDEVNNLLDKLNAEVSYITAHPHKLYFAARDIPPIPLLRTEELCRFKLFIWLISSNSKMANGLLPAHIPAYIVEKAMLLGNKYYDMNTYEIWTSDTFKPELQQIAECLTLGHINEEMALKLLKQYKQFIFEHYQMLEDENAKLHMYQVDFLLASNSALISSSQLQKAYIHITSVNYLQAKQLELCSDLKNWFEEQLSFATDLRSNYKQRLIFFNTMKRSIDKMIIQLE